MRNRLFLTLCLLLQTLFAYGQTEGNNDEQAASQEEAPCIDVVAYFSLRDTMEYTQVSEKLKITAGDTLVEYSFRENFQLIVTDSTSQGYRLEMVPLSFAVEHVDSAKNYYVELAQVMWGISKEMRTVFTTDELGTIQHIENWREIRDCIDHGLKKGFDKLYGDLPGLDSIMPRRQLESTINLQYSTESGIRAACEELTMMFGLHGRRLEIGKHESEDVNDAGFPELNKMLICYSDVENEQYDFEDDYELTSYSQVNVPMSDVMRIAKNAVGALVSDEMSEVIGELQLEEAISEELGNSMSIQLLEIFQYFFNGWPKCMIKRKITEASDNYQVIEYDSVEWTSRHWQ